MTYLIDTVLMNSSTFSAQTFFRLNSAKLTTVALLLGAGLILATPNLTRANDQPSASSSGVTVKRISTQLSSGSAKPNRLHSHKRKAKSSTVAVASRARRVVAARQEMIMPERPTFGQLAGLRGTPDPLSLKSSVAMVQDLSNFNILFAKNADVVLPIASISKLMTSMVVLEANQPLDEILEVSADDVDTEKNSRSRLAVGTRLTREDMLHLALMASENRAAHALARNYPGGMEAFVRAMNARALSLGMLDSRFVEPTGLSSQNVSSATDLVRMVRAAYDKPLIRQFSTDTAYTVVLGNRLTQFNNTNQLVGKTDWDIAVSKTGFISEAGKCLVMLTRIENRPLAIVLLDSSGKFSRIADAIRIRHWLERTHIVQASVSQ